MKISLFSLVLTTLISLALSSVHADVQTGLDRLFNEQRYRSILNNKRVALVTNQTSVDKNLNWAPDLFIDYQEQMGFQLIAFFAPEHGLDGSFFAGEHVPDHNYRSIPILSLHGKNRRPSPKQLKNIDLVVFDIQDIGSRSYTFTSTLFYILEEAAKTNTEVLVLDRPNPLGGMMIDGPLLKEAFRSFVGYINTPYCHGMTVGELAFYFNETYQVGANLSIIPMKGWSRQDTFNKTGLNWIPTSPHIPEAISCYFYPTTGILGELGIVNIGVGSPKPFQYCVAPWIEKHSFAAALNKQELSGVAFVPQTIKPYYGKFENTPSHGVLILITDKNSYKPVQVQMMLIGILKSLYPKQFEKSLKSIKANRKKMFNKVIGSDKALKIMESERYPSWKLKKISKEELPSFYEKRKPFLLY